MKVEGVETPEAPGRPRRCCRSPRSSRSARSTPSDVEVQLLHGPVGQHDEISQPSVVAMTADPSDASRWTAGFTCDRAGRYGYTVRIVPSHPDLTNPIDLGRIAWA